MYSVPTPFTGTSLDLGLPGVGMAAPLRWLLLIGVPLAVVFVLVWLYRLELRRVPQRVAAALMVLRLVLVATVLFLLLLDPTMVAVTQEVVPGHVVVAIDVSDSMRVADPHRPLADKLALVKALKLCPDLMSDRQLDRWIQAARDGKDMTTLTGEDGRAEREAVLRRIDETTRLILAERTLLSPTPNLLTRLRERHTLRLTKFDQTLSDLPSNPTLLDATSFAKGQQSFTTLPTDLSLPLRRGMESPDGQKLLGVILFTDGRHNWGESPLVAAAELNRRGVPVYPVLVAPVEAPPDVAVASVQAQATTLFQGVTVPVEATVRATDWPACDIRVRLTLPPVESGTQPLPIEEVVKHPGGDATHRVVLRARMDNLGPQKLMVEAITEGKVDRYPENNQRTVRVNVVKDRARLLLVDGEARWEFHYLHTCLGRDPTMDVRSVVYRQPRISSASDEELKLVGIPATRLSADRDALAAYDCVILGDVEPEQFPRADRERLEKYVAEDGGTVVFLAGKRALPMAYSGVEDDPLGQLLPVRSTRLKLSTTSGFALTPTAEGRKCWFLQMGDSTSESDEVWNDFPHHYWAATGEAKPAAEVLATTADDASSVIVRQNYGFGRVLYVGIDSTWRWRYKVGDKYHHRFWGQVARWAATDRLLPTTNPSGTIRFGTREPAYEAGQPVEVIAHGSEGVKPLVRSTPHRLRLFQLPVLPEKTEKLVQVVALAQPPDRKRDLSGMIRDLPPGRYGMELDVPEWSADLQCPPGPDGSTRLRSSFSILPPDHEELRDLSANRPLLEAIADSGKVYTPENVHELIERLRQTTATIEHRVERPLRRSWWWLSLIFLLLFAEWGLRKWSGLP